MQNTEFNTGVIKPVECAKEGFELIKSEYWILFAIWIVGAMLGGVSFFIVTGAMMCGTYYAYMRKIDGHAASFDDLWKGFQWFGSGLVVMLFIIVPMIIVYAIIYVPIVIAAAMGGRMSQDEMIAMLIGAFAVDFILIVIMVCVHTLLIFSFPLIVDRNLGAFAAMALSARAVLKNLGGVIGLLLVNFVLVIIGYLALCVGVYFVIPLIIAANVVAYRKVFPRMDDDRRYEPPPISAYGGG